MLRTIIDAGVYINESDFVRDAIRRRLSEIKVIKCRDVDYETAKKEVLGCYKIRGEALELYSLIISSQIFRYGRSVIQMHCMQI